MRALIARLRAYFAAELAIQRLERLDDHLLADMNIPREAIRQRVKATRTPSSVAAPQSASGARNGELLLARPHLG